MKYNEGKELMLGHTLIWLHVNVEPTRIWIMDSTNPLYLTLGEVKRRGQAERLDHRGLEFLRHYPKRSK